jgi:hypothetical protein
MAASPFLMILSDRQGDVACGYKKPLRPVAGGVAGKTEVLSTARSYTASAHAPFHSTNWRSRLMGRYEMADLQNMVVSSSERGEYTGDRRLASP